MSRNAVDQLERDRFKVLLCALALLSVGRWLSEAIQLSSLPPS